MVRIYLIIGSLFAFIANGTDIEKEDLSKLCDTYRNAITEYGVDNIWSIIEDYKVKVSTCKLSENGVVLEQPVASQEKKVRLPYSTVRKLIEQHRQWIYQNLTEQRDQICEINETKSWQATNSNNVFNLLAVSEEMEEIHEKFIEEHEKNNAFIAYLYKCSSSATRHICGRLRHKLFSYCKENNLFQATITEEPVRKMLRGIIHSIADEFCIKRVEETKFITPIEMNDENEQW